MAVRARGELAWHGCARAAGAVGECVSVRRGAATVARTRVRTGRLGVARRSAKEGRPDVEIGHLDQGKFPGKRVRGLGGF